MYLTQGLIYNIFLGVLMVGVNYMKSYVLLPLSKVVIKCKNNVSKYTITCIFLLGFEENYII